MNLTNEIKDLLDYQRKLKVDTALLKIRMKTFKENY